MSTELRALIVDDEPLSRRAMQQLLALHPEVRVVASCGDTLEAMPHLSGVDVVFLDVQLPGASGLDLARTLTSGGPPFVVFVTAFEAYAVPAFDTEALDYLQKPVAPERLAKALTRVRARLATDAPRAQEPEVRFAVRVGMSDVFFLASEIDWIEADGMYAAMHARGKRWLLRRSLDALETELAGSAFVRTHRRWIVATSQVVRVRRGAAADQRALVLRDGAVVPVSRRRWAGVARALRGTAAGHT